MQEKTENFVSFWKYLIKWYFSYKNEIMSFGREFVSSVLDTGSFCQYKNFSNVIIRNVYMLYIHTYCTHAGWCVYLKVIGS